MSDEDRPHDRYCEWWGECWCNPDPYGEGQERERREAEARRVDPTSDTPAKGT